MASTVEISRAVLDAIRVHAASSHDEVCGLLLGPSVGVVTVAQPCGNVASAPATRFEIDPAALLAAHRAARSGGPLVLGHYHSHPSGRAEPSATDAAEAADDGALWLIVAGQTVAAWRAAAAGALHGRFDPVAITGAKGCARVGQASNPAP